MELPRNITQVGETDRNCKIYVEDYVVSYMKQMNTFAEDREITIALYGRMSVEQQITYCFVYGACMVQSINREVRHLSQAQNQEVERMRRKYFPEQSFLGYQILNGDMIEGFRIYDQNSCRYVKGYACFFEKNDTMLAYMLEARGEEIQPEKVEQDKYEMVKKRQEDRRQQFEESRQPRKRLVTEPEKTEDKKAYQFKVAPFLALAGCCLIAMILWDRGNTEGGLKEQLNSWAGNINDVLFARDDRDPAQEAIILQSEEVEEDAQENAQGDVQENMQAVMSTLVTEDKLVDAILEENEKAGETTLENQEQTPENLQGAEQQPADGSQETGKPVEEGQQAGQVTGGSQTSQPIEGTQGAEQQPADSSQETGKPAAGEQDENTSQPTEVPQTQQPEPSQPTVQQPRSYTIQEGDTLIAISTRLYGNDSKVSQICKINNISNPDNIQIGQKILLP